MLGLEFNALGRGGGWRRAMTLGEVPPVLLSETWNDYREIAAAGTGFDERWEKKAEYW